MNSNIYIFFYFSFFLLINNYAKMATIETAFYVPTFLGLSTTFGISCAVSATCIIAFEICKRLDSMKCLFSPRTQLLK